MMGALANAGGNAIMALSANVRRVVTTIDSKDKAVVLLDGANPHKKVRPQAKTVSRLLWVTDQTPADLSGSADRAAIDIGIMPPRGGTVFRIVDFPPETSETSKLDPHTMHQSLGDGAPKRGLPPRHPAMHRTRTVDYAVVMAGEIDMLLDDFGNPPQGGRRTGATGHQSRLGQSRHRALSHRLHPGRCEGALSIGCVAAHNPTNRAAQGRHGIDGAIGMERARAEAELRPPPFALRPLSAA